MEQQTARRGANAMDELMKAYIDGDGYEIDVHEMLAIRDDLREIAEGEDSEIPEVGDTLYDGACPVTIEEVTDYTARLYHIENGDGPKVSEYETNKDCDPEARVVKVSYPSSDGLYPFPVDRLTEYKCYCDNCGSIDQRDVLGPEGHESCNLCGDPLER